MCRRANPRSYNVEEASELRPEWFEGAESVGICGATSTPKWLMQEVADAVAGRSRETKNPKYGRKAPARASVSETDKKFNLIKTITTMKYLIRSVKYFIALCVLYLIIMALMLLTNTSVLTPSETFSALVRSTRGQVLIVAVVLLSALYPKFGFIRRQEIGSLRKNREQILNAFVSEGFKPVRESEHEMVFRADSLFKRLTLLFEDEIRVTQTGEWITIEGIRRGVARVYYRLQSYLERTRNKNE